MKRMWSKKQIEDIVKNLAERKELPLPNVYLVDNVKTLSNEDIAQLRAGDIVVKQDASGNHPYMVSFRGETGICLTYTDASCIETQSYDLVDEEWTYNSEDKTPNLLEIPTKLEDIKDKDGNRRFIEGDISIKNTLPEGITKTYGKWSLSGTHLMIVLCLRAVNGTELPSGSNPIADIALPKWVMDKIVPVFGSEGIFVTSFNFLNNEGGAQAFSNVTLAKTSSTNIRIAKYGAFTLTADRDMRMSFDLLIDNE